MGSPHTASIHSYPPARQRQFLVASGTVAPVLSEGPIPALPDTRGRLVYNIMLGEGRLTSLRALQPGPTSFCLKARPPSWKRSDIDPLLSHMGSTDIFSNQRLWSPILGLWGLEGPGTLCAHNYYTRPFMEKKSLSESDSPLQASRKVDPACCERKELQGLQRRTMGLFKLGFPTSNLHVSCPLLKARLIREGCSGPWWAELWISPDPMAALGPCS